MRKIETAIEQIEIKESDKNRSTEDLLMDVIGSLTDANKSSDKRANLPEFNRVKNLFETICPNKNYFEKEVFEIDYNFFLRDTLEDHLACVVIKISKMAKTGKIEISETDYSRSLTRIEYKGKSTSELLFDIVSTIYDSSIPLHRFSIMLVRIEVLCEFLDIDLWSHVDLRLKYEKLQTN